MANLLGDCGYKTSMIGKWQLGFFKKDYLPWNSKGLRITIWMKLSDDLSDNCVRKFVRSTSSNVYFKNGEVFAWST